MNPFLYRRRFVQSKQLLSTPDVVTSLDLGYRRSSAVAALLRGFVCALLLPAAASALDILKTWDGGGNNNLFNNPNWDNLPSGTGTGSAPTWLPGTNTDSILFNGTDKHATGTPAVNLNVNGVDQTAYEFKRWTFSAGTYQINGAQNLTLGDTTASVNNTGWLTNSGTGTITFNPTSTISFRFGGIDASGGPVTLGTNPTLNLGFNLSAATNNVTIKGSSDVTIGAVIVGAGTDSTPGGELIKEGSNNLFLNGNSAAWGGRINLKNGVIRANKANSLGSSVGRTTIAGNLSTARLDITGGIGVDEPLYLAGRDSSNATNHLRSLTGNNVLLGAIALDSGGTEYGIQVDAGTLTLSGNIGYGTASGSTNLRIGGTGNGIVSGGIGAGGVALGIIKDGAGTWTLAGTNAYTGPTVVNAGRLDITTAQTGTGATSVADGSALGLTLAAQGQSFSPSAFTLGQTVGSTLALDLGSFGSNPTAPVIATGALTLNGSNTVNIKAGGLSVGQFPLITYSSVTGTVATGLTLGTLPARVTANLVDDAANSRVLLNVSVFDVPRWTGVVDANWDLDDGTGTGTLNWSELNSGLTTRFLQNANAIDAVRFDDTAVGSGDINLTTTLTPASVLVLNQDKAYTFSGTGKLSGNGGLTKQGSGSLTLLNTGGNDYSGTTTISGGVVNVGDGLLPGGGALGTGPVVNDASLVLNRPDAYTLPGAISGTGSITKKSTGTTTLSGASSFTGPVAINEGVLRLASGLALGAIDAGTTVATGATLDLNGQLLPLGEVVTIVGDGVGGAGALVNNGTGGISVGLKNLVLTGPATIGGSGRWDIRDNAGGVAVNGHTLTKAGTNAVYWADVGETGIGDLIITGAASRLVFEGTTTFGNQPGTITVETSAQLGLEDNVAVNTKPIRVNSGTIRATGGTTNQIDSTITIDTVATVDVAANMELVLGGKITGTGNLVKVTGGIVKITGENNDYVGVTQISAGQLWLGDDSSTGKLNSGEIINNNALHLRRTDTALNVTNDISGTGSVVLGNVNFGVDSQVVTLSGNNTFTGVVTLSRGFLRITNSSALGVGPKVIGVQSNKRPSLVLNGSAGNITLDSSLSFNTSSDGAGGALINEAGDNVIEGPVNLRNGSGGNTRFNVLAGSLSVNGPIKAADDATSDRTLLLDGVGANNKIGGVLANGITYPLLVTKEGAGTWTLEQPNTYTGATTVSAGVLKLGVNGSIATSPTISIASGAILDVASAASFALANQTLTGLGTVLGDTVLSTSSVVSPAGTAAAGTLTINGDLTLNGGKVQSNLSIPLLTSPTIADLVHVTGGLNITAPSSIEVLATGTPLAGSYRIIDYAGTLTGDPGTLSVINPTRYNVVIDAATPGQINLVFGGSIANLTWSGDGVTNTWDLNTAANWNAGADVFFPVDAVLFDDTSANKTISIAGTVLPSTVTVNTDVGYTFGGSGSIGGTSGLTKTGTGTLTISTSNSYTGKTKIAGGTIALTSTGRLTGTRWIEVDLGATFDASAITAGFTLGGITDPRVLSGRGSILGAFTVNSAGVIKPGASSDPNDVATAGNGIGALSFSANLTLAGAALPNTPRAWLQIAGPTGHVNDVLDLVAIAALDNTVPTQHDYLAVTSAFNLDQGSQIKIELDAAYTPVIGDVFNLVDFASVNVNANGTGGSFDAVADLDLPALPQGLGWNRSLFATKGILFIDVEPPTLGTIVFSPSSTVNPGATVSLSIEVTGTGPFTYQWLKGNAPISGETGETYSFTASETSEGNYSVKVTNQSGSTTSATAALVVNDPINITTHPQSQAVNPGDSVTLSVAGTGTAPFTYQWRKNGDHLDGETGDTLILDDVTEDDQAEYDVVVTNIVGSVPSNVAVLSVNDPVVITTDPQGQVVLPGSAVTFTVAGTSTGPFTYQWRKNGQPLQNQTNDTLTIASVTTNDAGTYDVVVTNDVNSDTSAGALLEVITGSTPRITVEPVSKLVAVGQSVTLEVTAVALPPIKYQWFKNNAAIKGATARTLSIPSAQLTSAGAYNVKVTSATTTPSAVAQLGVVSQVPTEQKLAGGGTATIKLLTAGTGLTHTWKKGSATLTTDTRVKLSTDQKTLTIKPTETGDAATYSAVVTGPGGTLNTGDHKLLIFTDKPEVLTPVQPPAAIVSGTYSFQIPVNPDPTKVPTSYSVTGLPAGLSINTTTGLITGKPLASKTKPFDTTIYNLTIYAINAKGKSDKATAQLTVSPLPLSATGRFAGPIERSALSDGLGGWIDFTTSASGTFSGKIYLGAVATSFSGALDAIVGETKPTVNVTAARKGKSSLVLAFTIDSDNHRVLVDTNTTATITDGVTPTNFKAWRNKWTAKDVPVNAYVGYYTFGLEIPQSGVGLPQGNGHGYFTIASSGALTFVGKLADGEKLSFASFAGPDGEVLLYQTFLAGKGSIVGTLDIAAVAAPGLNTLTGTLSWSRPLNTGRIAGFSAFDLTAVGGRYNAPVGSELVLGLQSGASVDLAFAEAGVPSTPSITVTLGAGHKITYPVSNPAKTSLKLTPKSGAFSGGFSLTDPNPWVPAKPFVRSVTYEGLIVPTIEGLKGFGFFLIPELPTSPTETLLKPPQLSGQALLEPSL